MTIRRGVLPRATASFDPDINPMPRKSLTTSRRHSLSIVLSIVLILLLTLALFFFVLSPRLFITSTFPPIRPANIAYFLQIAPSTIHHVPRLYARIFHPRNVYAIHFDLKIPSSDVNRTIAILRELVVDFDANSYIMPADPLVYSGISMVLNTISAIAFLNLVPNPWDFFINLSGSDYPLTAPDLPRSLLGRALAYDPLFFSLAAPDRWESVFRMRNRHLSLDSSVLTHDGDGVGRVVDLNRQNPLLDNKLSFIPVYGEAWMILPRAFCQYVMSSPEPRRMLLTMANMRGADEFYFSTLAFNHERFNRSIVPRVLRKVVWHREGIHSGQHPYYLDDIDEKGGFVFLDELRRAPQWHARKFRLNDSRLMHLIDEFAEDPVRRARSMRNFEALMRHLRSESLHELPAPPYYRRP